MRFVAPLFAGMFYLVAGCATPSLPATQPSIPTDYSQPIESSYIPVGPGPTAMGRVAGGYELRNRVVRVVISDRTGDVIWWGAIGQPRNTVLHRGIYATLSGLPDAPVQGYIEKRDDQTWQFFGEDANHIIWRKIYCLQGDSLLVSLIVLNNRPMPLSTNIHLNGDLTSLRIVQHEPEQFTGIGGYGTVSLHGYNEFHAPSSQPTLPILLQSDTFHLAPQERQGYTTQWILTP